MLNLDKIYEDPRKYFQVEVVYIPKGMHLDLMEEHKSSQSSKSKLYYYGLP